MSAFTGILGAALLRGVIEGGAMVLLVMLATRLLPRLGAATRCGLWWLACLRLVLALAALPTLALQMPRLPASAPELLGASLATTRHLSPAGPAMALAPGLGHDAHFTPPHARPARVNRVANIVRRGAATLTPFVLAAWLLGVALVLFRHGRDAIRLECLWRRAVPFRSARVRMSLAGWLGSGRAAHVEVRSSREAVAPMLLAGSHPRILVPESCRELESTRLELLLAHEVAHVRRHDIALGWVPALAHALYWFFPLARLAAEEYAQAREEACDADAVRAGDHALYPYGELLLAYGIDPQRRLPSAASYGSRHASRLHRRLVMLTHSTPPDSRQRTLGLITVLFVGLLALVPVRLVAARGDSSNANRTERIESVTRSASEPGATSEARSSDARRSRSSARASSSRGSGGSYGYRYSTDGDHDGFSFGYGHGDNLTLNGSFVTDDFGGIKGLGKDGREFGWFRLEGKDYVVYDAKALDQIREIMAPQEELGRRQSELGERQSDLGARQSDLGSRQGTLGDQQSELSERLAELEGQLASAERRSDARRQELRRKIADTRARLDTLEQLQEELSDRQDQLSRLQDQLGEMQDELGQQQEELSRRAREQMRRLADDLIARGIAQRTVSR